MSSAPNPQYRVGGHLPIDDPSYVVRAADRQFYEGLAAGELCYVLTSRQMGKTSLRFRTMHRLQQAGIACVAIDLQGIGSRNITPQQWYAGIVRRLAQGVAAAGQFEVRQWWQEREAISPVQRLSEFIELVIPRLLAERLQHRIAIFIDEIDSTLSLDFDTDDFFAAVRACSELDRVTFALIGVAAPADLVRAARHSPFNIGRAIELRGFQADEVQPLLAGIQAKAMRPEAVLAAILDWTAGQPFLTQKLCKLIQDLDVPLPSHYEAEFVETLVRSRIIADWEAQDEPEHLRTIRNYLVLSDKPHAETALTCYGQILSDGFLALDTSPAQIELQLSGLVIKERDRLVPGNRLYTEIFDRAWLDSHSERLRQRALYRFCPYERALAAWLESERQDRSYLLQGADLQLAHQWAQDKTLDSKHRDFLLASDRRGTKWRKHWRSIALGLLVTIPAIIIATRSIWPERRVQNPIAEIPDREERQQVRVSIRRSAIQRRDRQYSASLLSAVTAARQLQQIKGNKDRLKHLVRENLAESLDRFDAAQPQPYRPYDTNSNWRSLAIASCQRLQIYLETAPNLTSDERQICQGFLTRDRQ